MAIKYMHYLEKNEAICGVRFYGDARRILSTSDALQATCPACLAMDSGALGKLIEQEKRRLASIARRVEERATHLALKDWFDGGPSWQEARAMNNALEDKTGD